MDFNRVLLKRHKKKREGGVISHLQGSERIKSVFQKIDLLADFNPVVRFFIRTFKAKPAIASLFSTGSGELNIDGRRHALNCTAIHEFVNNLR